MPKKKKRTKSDAEDPMDHHSWMAPEAEFDPSRNADISSLLEPDDSPWLDISNVGRELFKRLDRPIDLFQEGPPPDPSLTAADAAAWMLAEIEEYDYLDQRKAVFHISTRFGGRFTQPNKRGNPSIKPEVLDEFEKIAKDKAIWSKARRYWRKRRPEDGPGRETRY